MSHRLAMLAAVPLATLAFAGTAAAAPAPSPAQGITLCHEGFEIQLAPGAQPDHARGVVVLIGANDYGLVARPPC